MKIRDTKRAFKKLEEGRPLTRKERVLVAKAMRRSMRIVALWVARLPETLTELTMAFDRALTEAFRVLSEGLRKLSQAQGGDGKCTP